MLHDKMTCNTPEKQRGMYRKICGCCIGLFMILCYGIGGVTVQALDKLIPTFELNCVRITGMWAALRTKFL